MTSSKVATFARFSDAEYARRRAAVGAMMAARDVGGLLIYASGAVAPIHYLTNFMAQRPTWFLLPADGESALLLNFLNHVPCAREMSLVDDISCFHPSAARAVADKIRDRGLAHSRIGVAGIGALPHAAYAELVRLLPECELVDVGRDYQAIRWVRSEEEIGWLRESARLTDEACRELERRIAPGLTEFDLQRIIHDAFLPEGGNLGLAFVSSTPMAAPERGVPWQYMRGRTLEPGDVVITELTVGYWGYSGQIHRPFAVAAEPTDLYRRLYDAALETYEAVRSVLVPGASSRDVVTAGEVVREHGFEIFDSLLHGEGGRNPELGTAASGHTFEDWTFEENQLMVIQPNPVTPDRRAGLQLGSAVLVRDGGAVPIHDYPFGFPVCAGQ